MHGHLNVKFYKILVGELEGIEYLGEIKVDVKENYNEPLRHSVWTLGSIYVTQERGQF